MTTAHLGLKVKVMGQSHRSKHGRLDLCEGNSLKNNGMGTSCIGPTVSVRVSRVSVVMVRVRVSF